jgi:predicted RND superfamily exporter protein
VKRLIKFAADHPWAVLLALAVITALSLTQLPKLHIHISAESMLEKGTSAWDYFVATEETFGSEDVAIVVLRDPDLFARDKLAAIHEVVRALNQLPYVWSTSSLFDVPNLKNIDGFIHTQAYLKAYPETADEVAQLKADAVSNPLVLGNLIAADGQAIAVNVFFDRELGDASFDRMATAAIEKLIAPLRSQIADVYQVGVSAMRSDLTGKIKGDQQVFLPLSVLVLLLTLAFSLRRATAVLIPLATAGLSVVWTLGFMAALGIPVNIMTSIVPALVIIIGSTEDIHLLAEYTAGIREGLARRAAIGRMADNMGMAVLLTFVTTYLGFLSIALNDIELLYQFGLVASTGLLFNFAITVLLVPVMLRGFGHQHSRSPTAKPGSALYQRWAVNLLLAVQRRRRLVFVAAGVLAGLALLAATQLRINNNLLDYLDERSELRANAERVHAELSGVHSFSIVVDSGINDTFLQVKYLAEVQKIQSHLAQMQVFDRSFSFADFVTLVNSVMADDQDNALRLPESNEILREYMLFIKQGDVASYVSPDFDRARILVRHNISSSDVLNAAVADLRAFVDANIDPALRVEITGKSVLSNKAVEEMAEGQLQSLLLVGGVIVVLVSVLFVSLRAGLIALVPNLFPVVILFGVMALTGIPLNAGTSMVAAIALGICVDDTMHVMARFHEELKQRETREAALAAMIQAEAVPIFATSIALAAGFAVFATSSFQPVVNFGLLSAMVILVALLATFILTPLLLGTSELLTVWDLLSYKVQNEALRRSPLFQGMYVWQIKKLLLASEIRAFAANQQIIKEGDDGSEMFVILEGAVEASKTRSDGRVDRLRSMHVGELFGEVAPLSSGRRTADVIALEDTQLLVLSWGRIDRLTHLYPILAFRLFRNLTRIIGARLTQTSEYQIAPGRGEKPATAGREATAP